MRAQGVMLKWEQYSDKEKSDLLVKIATVVAARFETSVGMIIRLYEFDKSVRVARGVLCEVLLDMGLMKVEVAEVMAVNKRTIWNRVRSAKAMDGDVFQSHVDECVAQAWKKLDREGGEA